MGTGISGRLALLVIMGATMGLGRQLSVLGIAFRAAQMVNPPANDYTPHRAEQYRNNASAHYNHAARHQTVSGKAHGFAPPARPSKKKGYPRSAGRFY